MGKNKICLISTLIYHVISDLTVLTICFNSGGALMSGWLPIFDTINGVRGEVNVQVKVELFSDHNKFRQSSCGVQFFYSKSIQVQCTLAEQTACIVISPSNTKYLDVILIFSPKCS